MTCAATTCRMTILATTLFLPAAASSGLAEEAASPRLAMRARANGLDWPAHSPSAASDLGRAGESSWLAQCRVGRADLARGDSRSPCWAWCTLGLMSLTILGLFSFGWHEGHLPEGSEEIARHEEHRTEPSRRADAPVAEAAPTPGPKIDAPKLSGGNPPLPDVLRPCYSLCIGLCAGGDVWGVACGV